MTAIFQNRGKQYKANVGDYLKLPKLSDLKKNDLISFEEIIFYKNEKGESFIGSPFVKGIVINAKVVDQIRDKKVIVFKKKRRHNYRRKIGHRQDLTLLKIEEIKANIKTDPKNSSEKKRTTLKDTSKGESNGS